MKSIGICVSAAAIAALSACTNPDSVLFVTATSIGIDVDSKPPTASIAYNRVEGFLGPRYDNGGLPPVVASIETGGNVFNPKIRQVYATGNAAERATSVQPPPVKERELSGGRKLAFFGTGTTIGLKVGFGPQGVPDSLTFGYKRFEASLIPLGTTEVKGRKVDVYPSVVGSVDTVTNASTLPATGLTSAQFFATGQAAEALASTRRIGDVFKDIAEGAVGAASPERVKQNDRLAKILEHVAPGGAVDAAKLAALVDATNKKFPNAVPVSLKTRKTVDEIKRQIGNNQVAVGRMFEILSAM